MENERKFCKLFEHHPDYTVEIYTDENQKETVRITVIGKKAYVMYMKDPDTLDGRYDVVLQGGVWEGEKRLFVDVSTDGLTAKEFIASLYDMGEYMIFYPRQELEKYKG